MPPAAPSPDLTDIPRRALHALRAVISTVGRKSVVRSEVSALAAACDVVSTRDVVQVGYVVTRLERTSSVEVVTDPDLIPERMVHFLVVLECLRRLFPKARRGMLEGAALAVVYGLDDEVAFGSRWVRTDAQRALWQVRPAGWGDGDGLRRALRLRKAALRSLSRLEGPAPDCTLAGAHEAEGWRIALTAGKRLRDAGHLRLCAPWFRLAYATAKAAGNCEGMAFACGGQALAWKERGSFPRARRLFRREVALARAARLSGPAALGLHDLASLCIEAGDEPGARRYARQAWRLYPADHPARVYLAHDLAYLWVESGQFHAAVKALTVVVPRLHREQACYQALAKSNLCRAAAGAGVHDLYESLWPSTFCDAVGLGHRKEAARVWLNLAHAAISTSDFIRAQSSAARSEHIAEAFGMHRVSAYAAAMLDAANRGQLANCRALNAAPEVEQAADEIARMLAAA